MKMPITLILFMGFAAFLPIDPALAVSAAFQVTDINKRPDLEYCATTLEKMNK